VSERANNGWAAADAAGDHGAPLSPEQNLPRPSFEILGARVPRHAVAPNLVFDLEVNDPSGLQVFTISLAVQIAIEPAQRRYDPDTRERLTELLGEPGRIGAPTRTMPWAKVDVLVHSFKGTARVEVPVLCNYDLEIAATNYFHSIADGEVPLVFHFNGGIYYQGDGGQLQIVQLSWEESSNYRMPIAIWEEMIAAHYPYRGWVPAGSETIERLRRYKLEQGLPSYEAALERLLDR
jgi:Family of unknown function (DUF6084)